jgi:GNAT superfamily N-acetyltransferase
MVGHDGHRGWLYYVAARPTSRSKGVGWRMVQAAENWLRQRRIVKVELLVVEIRRDDFDHLAGLVRETLAVYSGFSGFITGSLLKAVSVAQVRSNRTRPEDATCVKVNLLDYSIVCT